MRINPAVVPTAHANRAFLARATRYLTAEAGLRQFLDIGTCMSAGSNIHEVASRSRPNPASSTWTTTHRTCRPQTHVTLKATCPELGR